MIEEIFYENVESYNLIKSGQKVVLGLSGGPDSVCLFYLLNELAKKSHIEIHPVHINHSIRPKAADEDQAYCERLSRELGWQCTSLVFDCNKVAREQGITSEEAGRNFRYEAFRQKAEELGENSVIALAHNMDDQVETILFRLLRGTGPFGLAGMDFIREDIWGDLKNTIVRPLLNIPKSQILEFCREKGLNPCIDATNGESIYARNKIRLELIPYIEKNYNPSIRQGIFRLGELAKQDRKFIEKESERLFEKSLIREKNDSKGHLISLTLDGDLLRECHEALIPRIAILGLKRLGLNENITYGHVDGIIKVIHSDSPSASWNLPNGYIVCRQYENIVLCRECAGERTIPKANCGILSIEELSEFKKQLGAGKELLMLDADKLRAYLKLDDSENMEKSIMSRLCIRYRESGDFIAIGGGHHKKIKNLFVDIKLPKALRDKALIVALGHEVLTVWTEERKGVYTCNFKVDESTENVFYIEKPHFI